jgi:hypothetical protein
MAKRQYPLSIRDVAPGPDAVRLTGNRANGGSDGFHTGGAWLYQGKVWKPLDGRPYANANIHVETNEEDCLTALQGKPLFPKNWEIKEANGRRFIVRDHVPTFPGGNLSLTKAQIQEIDRGIAQMNASKWEVNDDLVIGKDRGGRLFIVDLSAANYTTGTHAYAADDWSHFAKLCEQAGFKDIPAMKNIARELSVEVIFNGSFKGNKKVNFFYSADKEVKIKGTVDLNGLIDSIPAKDRPFAKKYFWLGSTEPLTSSVVSSNRLTLRHARKS